jgi:hypothetical protein
MMMSAALLTRSALSPRKIAFMNACLSDLVAGFVLLAIAGAFVVGLAFLAVGTIISMRFAKLRAERDMWRDAWRGLEGPEMKAFREQRGERK